MKMNGASKVIEKAVLCHLCGRRFKTESWKRHHVLMSHSNDLEPSKEDGLFHCPMCPKRYKGLNSRSLHIVKMHCKDISENGEVCTYRCQLCSDSFTDLSTLNLHMKLHAIQKSKSEGNTSITPQPETKVTNDIPSIVTNTPSEGLSDFTPSNPFLTMSYPSYTMAHSSQFLGMPSVSAAMCNFAQNQLGDISSIMAMSNGQMFAPQIEQKPSSAAFFNDLQSFMNLSDSGFYTGIPSDFNGIAMQGAPANLISNLSPMQLQEIASTGKLMNLPDMYANPSIANQSTSATNEFCFDANITANIDPAAYNAVQQQMLGDSCMRVKLPEVQLSPQSQQLNNQLLMQNFPTQLFANNITLNNV